MRFIFCIRIQHLQTVNMKLFKTGTSCHSEKVRNLPTKGENDQNCNVCLSLNADPHLLIKEIIIKHTESN